MESKTQRFTWIVGLAVVPLASVCAGEPIFIPTKIDGPIHDPPNHTYWFGPFSECCSVADFQRAGLRPLPSFNGAIARHRRGGRAVVGIEFR